MLKMSESILILTTAHWEGDPRLNRHLAYLKNAGQDASIIALMGDGGTGRIRNAISAFGLIWRRRAHAVLLPDPELFVVGSLIGRFRGVRTVIDVHEDYARAASGRDWIPTLLKPLVAAFAWLNDRVARRVAHANLVAAPELAGRTSNVVLNIPDPSEFEQHPPALPAMVAYVGDVTIARGAVAMAELAASMPDFRFLIVGRVDADVRSRMESIAPDNLELAGRRPHAEAWTMISGALAGLSLLQPLPAYREAVATKLWEYCAAGIPPVGSDLPGQSRFLEKLSSDLIVRDMNEARSVLERLAGDRSWSEELRSRSRQLAEEEWERHRPDLAVQRVFAPRPMTRRRGDSSPK